jgi:hypothetical protein
MLNIPDLVSPDDTKSGFLPMSACPQSFGREGALAAVLDLRPLDSPMESRDHDVRATPALATLARMFSGVACCVPARPGAAKNEAGRMSEQPTKAMRWTTRGRAAATRLPPAPTAVMRQRRASLIVSSIAAVP